MKHTPYGYDFIGGVPVINEEQAQRIRRTCENYLSGMSFASAAAEAGIPREPTIVKRMLKNRRYAGKEGFPEILPQETIDRVEEERVRRARKMGRDQRKKKGPPEGTVWTGFSAPKIKISFSDPVKQAEYAYSQIRNEVKR